MVAAASGRSALAGVVAPPRPAAFGRARLPPSRSCVPSPAVPAAFGRARLPPENRRPLNAQDRFRPSRRRHCPGSRRLIRFTPGDVHDRIQHREYLCRRPTAAPGRTPGYSPSASARPVGRAAHRRGADRRARRTAQGQHAVEVSTLVGGLHQLRRTGRRLRPPPSPAIALLQHRRRASCRPPRRPARRGIASPGKVGSPMQPVSTTRDRDPQSPCSRSRTNACLRALGIQGDEEINAHGGTHRRAVRTGPITAHDTGPRNRRQSVGRDAGCGMRDAGRGCGMRDAGCGMRDAGCGMRDAGCGMRDAGCGMRDAGCGMRDAGCGMRDAGFGMRDAGLRLGQWAKDEG